MVLQIFPRQKGKRRGKRAHFAFFFFFPPFCIRDHILNNTGHYLLFQLPMLYSISLALPHGFALVSCVHCAGICFIMIHKRQYIFNAHYQAFCTFPLPLLLPPAYGLCLVCHLTASTVKASASRFAPLRKPEEPNVSSPATSAFPSEDSEQQLASNPPFTDLMLQW